MMPKLGSTFATCAAVAFLSLTGCYTYHPWGTHPGMMAPNGAPMFPPMQPVPQSTFVMPGDTAGSPAGGTPVGTPQSTFVPNSELNAPEPGGAAASGVASPVPVPREPGENAAQAPTGLETSSFSPPLYRGAQRTAPGEPGVLPFQEPFTMAEAAGRNQVVPVSLEDELTDPLEAGYAHDPQYRWFQGKAEFDTTTKSWHLLYDLIPDDYDQLGGEIQLGSNLQLDPKFSGRLMRVSGEFDTSRLDRLTKPIYVVQRIEEVR